MSNIKWQRHTSCNMGTSPQEMWVPLTAGAALLWPRTPSLRGGWLDGAVSCSARHPQALKSLDPGRRRIFGPSCTALRPVRLTPCPWYRRCNSPWNLPKPDGVKGPWSPHSDKHFQSMPRRDFLEDLWCFHQGGHHREMLWSVPWANVEFRQ